MKSDADPIAFNQFDYGQAEGALDCGERAGAGVGMAILKAAQREDFDARLCGKPRLVPAKQASRGTALFWA
jgi:hypothetical protein